MAYTVFTETLVYYTLMTDDGNYYNSLSLSMQGPLVNCELIPTISQVKELQKQYPQFKHIRKIKVIDIGEV